MCLLSPATGGKMTKALHVCRHLKAVGWRVLLLETHKYWHVGSRFSQSVDAFFTVPVPEDEPAEYVQQIVGEPQGLLQLSLIYVVAIITM